MDKDYHKIFIFFTAEHAEIVFFKFKDDFLFLCAPGVLSGYIFFILYYFLVLIP